MTLRCAFESVLLQRLSNVDHSVSTLKPESEEIVTFCDSNRAVSDVLTPCASVFTMMADSSFGQLEWLV